MLGVAKMRDDTIVRVDWARLEGRRPRNAGSNARLGEHGLFVRPPVARLTTADGATGFGPARLTPDQASRLLGARVSDLFGAAGMAEWLRPSPADGDAWMSAEFPLLDLAGRLAGQPVYRLAAGLAGRTPPETSRVRAYDTSLYFDDLHLADDAEAAALIASEALEGQARGHRAFKIKVGRGGRHLPLEQGTRRDVAVIRAVREAVGPDAPIMIDANNGYNLNLTKRVLAETAHCRLYWIEEPFHEDPVLYRDLKEWMDHEGLDVLIADGEGQASPTLLDWARDGLVDAVQYDVFRPGFSRWIEVGQQLDEWGRIAAPHHYGAYFGNFTSGQLAGAIRGFAAVEWDEAAVPQVDASRYAVREGWIDLPAAPGFGLDLDDDAFSLMAEAEGFVARL
jgi:L-alanine-DL-glutamate epimerase-like enolase superfamily enzyme